MRNTVVMNYWTILVCVVLIVLHTSCKISIPEEYTAELENLPEYLDFNIHVKPILSDKCFSCHGPDKGKREADLNLDNAESAMASLTNSPGKVAITQGNIGSSEVYHRIISDDPEYIMPPPDSHLSLTKREKTIIMKWIDDGAEYKPHWAFIKPQEITPPELSSDAKPNNEIDNFVIDRLEREGLQFSKEADKELLLRRASFDLTGLPPSEVDVRDFLNDDAPNAYEKQVDRLISSPHYGEKMAIDWMDLARYSDTHGYQADFYRDVSPWRDWVIKSFNSNMSYDQFVEWQIAGDLLPKATREQVLATTFNRLHPQNTEGGIIDEEYRVEYVADRVSIVGTGIMGLSLACAKCHDHKFDPITQKNFFEMFSFFNNVNETGQISWNHSIPVPTLLLPSDEQEEIIAYLENIVTEKIENVEAIKDQSQTAAEEWITTHQYKSIHEDKVSRGLVANFNLNNNLRNSRNSNQLGIMSRTASKDEMPTYTEGHEGKGLLLDGDAWLDLQKIGVFRRKDEFSIGIWVNIPEGLEEGVIFHKCEGARLYSYRGYHLYLKDNKLELMLAHTWPDNSIVKHTVQEVPKDEWIHLMLTYDGSSQAAGLKIYQDGEQLETEIAVDNLYKDITLHKMVNGTEFNAIEPGLQIGARWRGVGIKGGQVDDISVYNKELSGIEVLKIADPSCAITLSNKTPDHLNDIERTLLKEYFLYNKTDDYNLASLELRGARTTIFDTIEQVKEIMVMKEMETPRKAYVLERGLYDSYGEEVFPNVPEYILPWKETFPKNRLGLVKWLMDRDHPLTARVTVNRYWQNYFGRGLVASTEDFGNQGEMPSHLELLDWLALEFISSGWDIKALQKSIVMSATYRQSSITSSELLELDPENILLARGPQARLSSEMMRDNALAASGLLNKKIGGESVYPYQPDGLWAMNTGTYKQDKGDKLYRRSLYTIWKRTVPNPTLSTFDQPDREVCTVRRQKTNTPLQALVLLNDPTYLEAAKVIGETITKNESIEKGISIAYNKATGRKINAEQLKVLLKLQEEEYGKFKSDRNRSKGWLEAGDYTIDNSLNRNSVAANAVVASVILNSDAVITKR